MRRCALLVTMAFAFGAATSPLAAHQQAPVSIFVRNCFQGRAVQSDHLTLAVFNASEVRDLVRLADEYRAAGSPTDNAGVTHMFGLLGRLRGEVAKRKALARVNGSPRGGLVTLSVPKVPSISVFGFISGEGEEERAEYATSNLSDHGPNRIVLPFSPPEECHRKPGR